MNKNFKLDKPNETMTNFINDFGPCTDPIRFRPDKNPAELLH